MGDCALPKLMTLELHELEHDTATQSRVAIDADTVERYGELMRDGIKFDPIVVFYDSVRYYRADGWHRTAAAEWAGKKSIACHIYEGSKEDAELYAAGANARHGKPMNNADKRKAIGIVLRLHPEWTDSRIAGHVGVNHKTVKRCRDEVGNFPTSTYEGSLSEQLQKRIGVDGKSYPVPKPTRTPVPAAEPDTERDPLFEDVMAEDAAMMKDWRNRLLAIKREISEYEKDPERPIFPVQMRWTENIGCAAWGIGQYIPTGICPTCGGDGEGRGDYADGRRCRECQGTGYDCAHIQHKLKNKVHFSTAG